MQLKSLHISNILSIESADITFQNSGLMLIDGWNYDDNTANGAGKTSIWNALSFGLYGKLPRKVTVSEIVRRGAKSGHVRVELEVDGNEIVIERHRPKKEKITVNGEDIPTQEELEKYLKLTYKQFIMCVYASQTGQSKFIELSDSDKKDFFLSLLDLLKFEGIKGNIDSTVSQISTEILDLNHTFEKCDVRIAAYQESLESADDLKIKLAQLDTKELKAKLENIDITKPDVSKLDSLKHDLSKKLQSLRDDQMNATIYRNKVKEIDQRISSLTESLTTNSTIMCPHCSEDFMLIGENSLTVEQLEQKIHQKISVLQESRSQLVTQVNKLSENASSVSKIQGLIERTIAKKDKVLSTYMKNKEQYTEIRSKINIRQNQIDSITSQLETIKETGKKIAALEEQQGKISTSLQKKKQSLTVYKTLSEIFSSTGAQAYVMDNVIDLFNQRVADYVAMIWPSATYALLPYKANKSGSVKAKLSDKLIIAGKEVSLGSLSGGERRCLSLSIDFAILETLEYMTGINIGSYILDEPFEGLDAANRERAISMLERVAQNRQVWIIDHQSEIKAMFSDIMRIEKHNGVSRIV